MTTGIEWADKPFEIKMLRSALKLSQAELGAWLGVSAMAVSRWERGEAEPSAGHEALLFAMKQAIDGAGTNGEIRDQLSTIIRRPEKALAESSVADEVASTPGLPAAVAAGGIAVLAAAGLWALLKR